MANAIHVIVPYRHASTWVFDDPRVGLAQEPFVSGIPEMIDTMVADIPNAEKGVRLLFASEPFPGYQVELEKVRKNTRACGIGGTTTGRAGSVRHSFCIFQKRLLVSTPKRRPCSVHAAFSAHTHRSRDPFLR